MGVLWIVFCVGVGFFANSRGRSGVGWGLLAVLISPLIAAIILACVKDLTVESDVKEVKMETERIKDRMYYNEKLTDYRLKQVERNTSPNPNYQGNFSGNNYRSINASYITCNSCGCQNSNFAKFCESCGGKIDEPIYNNNHANNNYVNNDNRDNEDDMRICPYCKEKIKKDALKCKHCMSMLD